MKIKKAATAILVLFFSILLISCGSEEKKETPTGLNYNTNNSYEKENAIREYNLKVKEEQASNRFPCDTLLLLQYVLRNYPEGSYLVDFDRTLTYNIPHPAVMYYYINRDYIFAVIAKSKAGERSIEPNNIVGYDQSYINLDSTKLGTAFFYLTLFKCENNNFSVIWEAPIPSHGGFNNFSLKKWNYNGTPFIKVDFHYAQGSGHIDYNYFLVDGLTSQPHLLMTYETINSRRTLANVNNDKYPDYYEYVYYDSGKRVSVRDSVAFIWNTKKNVYINTRNSRQTRPY
jgi:hypothetical protein